MLNKIKTLAIAMLAASLIFFTSCDDDDNNSPTISDMEIGTSDSHIGIVGDDLHTQAEIVADATIDDVIVKIYKESGEGWSYDSTFTEFQGSKNYTYHKHIDIPSTADTGSYVFSFTVTDMDGQETSLKDDLTIQYPTDLIAPILTITSAPENGATFNTGDVITISGYVTEETALGGIYIGLVRNDQNLENTAVNANNTITLLHNHDFDDPTSYSFTASITVGAEQDNNITPKTLTGEEDYAWQSANYYIVAKSKDAYGANWGFSDQYPIVISYE